MTDQRASLDKGTERQRTFGDAAKEFVAGWIVIWLVSLFVVEEPFAPTLPWLLYSSLSALVAPVLMFYVPLLLLSYAVRRMQGRRTWWPSHRFAILGTVVLSAMSLYGMSLGNQG